MKDLFSTSSDQYAKYPRSYPQELVEYIISKCKQTKIAWDAGAGSGQLTVKLAPHFDEIFGTDISYEQLKNAPQISNITYHIQPAEDTTFSSEQFDLVTVAHALHWFDMDVFFKEVHRVLKPNGVFAAAGYGLSRIDAVDELLTRFYRDEIGEYWGFDRKLVEDQYQTVAFPFENVAHREFEFIQEWSLDDFLGYLKTWSAVKRFEKENGSNPVDDWTAKFAELWGDSVTRKVITPVFLRIGEKP